MKRQVLVLALAFVMIVVTALALSACGKDDGDGSLGDISVGVPEQSDEPSEPAEDSTDNGSTGSDSNYSVNAELLSYIGKSPDEIKGLLGEYDETMWYTGVIFRYGELWVAFDGNSEEPAGDLSFILCGVADLIVGLDSDVETTELDKVFGGQGAYDANEENGNEWFGDGFVTYKYKGFVIDIGCSSDMLVNKDGSALVWAG